MKCLFLLAMCGPDLVSLGSEEHYRRESSEARLVALGDLAYPVLLLAANSADLERRQRVRRILRQVLPSEESGVYPPLALLAGKPIPEWCFEENYVGVAGGYHPGEGWRLGWLRPDTKSPGILYLLILHYGEKARTQYLWKSWHLDADGRRATGLLCKDLASLGVPLPAIRVLLDYLREKEVQLCRVPRTAP